MLRPVRMCRIDCMVTHEKKDQLISALHVQGIAQLEFLEDEFLEETALRRDRPLARVDEVSELIIRIRKIIDSLAVFDISQVGFIEDILGIDKTKRVRTGESDFRQLVSDTKELLGNLDGPIDEYQNQVTEFDKRKADVEDKIKAYSRLRDLDICLEYVGQSRYLYTQIGLITANNYDQLEKALNEKLESNYMLLADIEAEGEIPAVITVLKNDHDSLNQVLSALKFDKISVDGNGKITSEINRLKEELKEIVTAQEQLNQELSGLHSAYYSKLLVVEELLEIQKQRCEIFVSCGVTQKTALIRLWVPKSNCRQTEKLIRSKTENLCFIDIDWDPEDAPVLLGNPKYIRSFELLTRLFSIPKYNQIDPTLIIAPTFCLFFGLMLTDAVYGVILIGVALMLNKKYGRYSQGLKDMCVILTGCGLAAIFFGILTGSYLGDLVGKYLLHGVGSQTVALWKDPLYETNSMIFLALVCVVGFVHIFVGYLAGAYDCVRRGKIKDAITQNISWFILLAGLAVYVLSGYPSVDPLLPSGLSLIGALISIVALALLFVGYGPMLFIKITGIVGNTLSYARLLALGLTTAGIAMTFNFLAQMSLGISYVGIIIAPLIFILGHVINILINTLGAFVHSLRLHYVEFFGTFYEGGGTEFTPFEEKRRYTSR